MAEKMPSSVKVGVRPIRLRMCAYSCAVRPCAAASTALTRPVTRPGSIALVRAFVALRGDLALASSFFLDADFRGALLLGAGRIFAAFRGGLEILGMRPETSPSTRRARNDPPTPRTSRVRRLSRALPPRDF